MLHTYVYSSIGKQLMLRKRHACSEVLQALSEGCAISGMWSHCMHLLKCLLGVGWGYALRLSNFAGCRMGVCTYIGTGLWNMDCSHYSASVGRVSKAVLGLKRRGKSLQSRRASHMLLPAAMRFGSARKKTRTMRG